MTTSILSNEVEDQFNSHLDLQQFCTVDNSLVGTAGMKRKINVYKATDWHGEARVWAKVIPSPSRFLTLRRSTRFCMAQNKFEYYDEQEMTDPMLVPVGTRHMGTDLFNTVNGDIYGEFKKATMVVLAAKIRLRRISWTLLPSLNIESTDNQPEKVAPQTFAFIHMVLTLPSFVRISQKTSSMWKRSLVLATSVLSAGVNIYTKKDATKGTVVVATRQAVTIFNKKGVEIETGA